MKNKKNLIKIMCIFLFSSMIIFGEENKIKEESKNQEVNIQEKEIGNGDEKGVDYFDVYDPWEPFNRRMYYFNYYFDKYLFLPIVDTYTFVTPDLVETGVNNFYTNSKNVSVMVNSAAQGKVRKFMKTLGRFSMNSILGVFGTVDVATELDMPKSYEDFGTTLSYYGVPKGPYLVLPILGPTNLKNAAGTGINAVAIPKIHPYTQLEVIDMENIGISVFDAINTRKNTPFRYYGSGSPFEYEYTRFIYTEFRKNLEGEE